jgi:hypothetical protein
MSAPVANRASKTESRSAWPFKGAAAQPSAPLSGERGIDDSARMMLGGLADGQGEGARENNHCASKALTSAHVVHNNVIVTADHRILKPLIV